MRVLVCGGRYYADKETVDRTLDALFKEHGDTSAFVVIQGGQTGADALAKAWARSRSIDCLTFMADWKRWGRPAGPIRNKQMLDEGDPDLVVAFPGGGGTEGMIRLARVESVPVMRIALGEKV